MTESAQQRWLERLELPILLSVYAAVIFLVDPRGNFPLNDDWDFGLATFWFARDGEFRFTLLTATSLRTQVVWGAAWVKLFGESFDALRASTLCAGFIALLIVARIQRRLSLPVEVRLISVLALFFNPLFFWNDFTYLTHVPYICVSAAALYFFLRALQEDRLLFSLLGSVATFAAFYLRQWGIVNAIAALAVLLLLRERVSPRWIRLAAAPASMTVLFALLYRLTGGLAGSPSEFVKHHSMWTQQTFGVTDAISMSTHYSLFSFQLQALFFAPLLIPVLFRLRRARALRVGFVLLAAIFGTSAAMLALKGYVMPYWALPWCCDIFNGNIFINFGLGPPTLPDVWTNGAAYPFTLGWSPRVVLTAGATLLGAAFAALLLAVLVEAPDKPRGEAIGRTLFASHIGAAFAILFVSEAFFDRYSLDVLWTAVFLLPMLVTWSRKMIVLSIVMVSLVGFFSIFATQEYLRWNARRWEAVNDLMATGVPLTSIDAGQEVWKYLQPDRAAQKTFVPTGEYLIAFNSLPNYRVVRSYPFSGYLGLHRASVLVLKRESEPASAPARR